GTSQPRPAADAGPEPQGWLAAQDLRIRRNLARLQEDPELLKHAFLSSMPSALFLLVPVFALLLKLAYLGSGRLYLEHLVVALFSHAFLCLALLGQMLLALGRRLPARGRRRLGPGSTGAMAVDARLPAADAEAGLCPGLARDPAALRRGGRGVLGADGAGGGRRVRPEPGAALAAGSAQGDLLQPGGPARGGQGQHFLAQLDAPGRRLPAQDLGQPLALPGVHRAQCRQQRRALLLRHVAHPRLQPGPVAPELRPEQPAAAFHAVQRGE